jgi:hypothetical protein
VARREKHKPVFKSIPEGQTEQWRPVPGLESLFIVSSLGRVARMVGHVSANRYRHVCMPKKLWLFKGHSMGATKKGREGVRVYVHHLVALAFIGPPPDPLKSQINHKDLDRSNNRVENLEWCSQQENMAHWRRMRPGQREAKLRPWKSSVAEWHKIRRLYTTGRFSMQDLADKFGLSKGGVRWAIRSPRYREAA